MNVPVFVMNYGNEIGPSAGYFDTATQTYFPKHPSIGGFSSNLTVCLWGISRLLNRGYLPKHISFRDTMEWYKDEVQDDIYGDIIQADDSQISGIDLSYRYPERKQYDPLNIHGNYRRIDYTHITPLIRAYFSPSEAVLVEMHRIIDMLKIDPHYLVSVFYRGTDHWKEGATLDPQQYLSVTNKILSRDSRYKVLIQTDQAQIRDLFLHQFKRRCVFIEELPVTIRKDADSLINLQGVIPDKRRWNIVYMAAMVLLSNSKFVVNHTGNSACWVNLLRGNSEGVYQFSIKGKLYASPWRLFDFFTNIKLYKGL